MESYIAAIDQGTTSTRCIIFNKKGQPLGSHQLEHEQIFPKPGWVEHNPNEIWARTQDVIREAMKLAGAQPEDIAAIGITNQRETTVVWDKASGKIGLQRHRLAGYAHGCHHRRIGERVRAGPLPQPGWTAAGHLFFRAKDQVDPG